MEKVYKFNRSLNDMIDEHDGLFEWCLGNAVDRFMGELSEDKIAKLDEIKFPWEHYENLLDRMGFNWETNNPTGIRYKGWKRQ